MYRKFLGMVDEMESHAFPVKITVKLISLTAAVIAGIWLNGYLEAHPPVPKIEGACQYEIHRMTKRQSVEEWKCSRSKHSAEILEGLPDEKDQALLLACTCQE